MAVCAERHVGGALADGDDSSLRAGIGVKTHHQVIRPVRDVERAGRRGDAKRLALERQAAQQGGGFGVDYVDRVAIGMGHIEAPAVRRRSDPGRPLAEFGARDDAVRSWVDHCDRAVILADDCEPVARHGLAGARMLRRCRQDERQQRGRDHAHVMNALRPLPLGRQVLP